MTTYRSLPKTGSPLPLLSPAPAGVIQNQGAPNAPLLRTSSVRALSWALYSGASAAFMICATCSAVKSFSALALLLLLLLSPLPLALLGVEEEDEESSASAAPTLSSVVKSRAAWSCSLLVVPGVTVQNLAKSPSRAWRYTPPGKRCEMYVSARLANWVRAAEKRSAGAWVATGSSPTRTFAW